MDNQLTIRASNTKVLLALFHICALIKVDVPYPSLEKDMDILTGRTAFVAACGYLCACYENLQANEMAEVMIFGNHFSTTGPGPKLIPKPIFSITRFPTCQFNLKVKVKVTAAQAELARYYDSGVERRFSSLSDVEQHMVLSNPLNHSFNVEVEAPIIYQFERSEMYEYIKRIGNQEKLEQQLSEVARSELEGIFGKITVATALSHKSALSTLYKERINEIVSGGETDPIWGIRVGNAFIGPIELDAEVAKEQSLSAASLAESKRIIVISEARKKELILLGQGRATAIESLANVMETPTGKEAAVLDAMRDMFKNSEKLVVAPNMAGALQGIKEVLGNMTQK
jgi:regulator of protease activity HflC (stomatin/prohibitin superfamily)